MPSRSKNNQKGARPSDNPHRSKKNFKKKHHKKKFQNKKHEVRDNINLDNELFDFDGPIPLSLLPTSMMDSLKTKRNKRMKAAKSESSLGKQNNYRKLPVFEKLKFFPVVFIKATEVYDPSAQLNARIARQSEGVDKSKSENKGVDKSKSENDKLVVEDQGKDPGISVKVQVEVEDNESIIPIHTIPEVDDMITVAIGTSSTDTKDAQGSNHRANLETKLEDLKLFDSETEKVTSENSDISKTDTKNVMNFKKKKPTLNTEDVELNVSDYEYDYEESHEYDYAFDTRPKHINEADFRNNIMDWINNEDDDDDEEVDNEGLCEKENQSKNPKFGMNTDSLGNTIFYGYEDSCEEEDDDDWIQKSDNSLGENNQEGYFDEDEFGLLDTHTVQEYKSVSNDSYDSDDSENEKENEMDMDEDISPEELLQFGKITGVKFGGINADVVDDYMDDMDPYITQSIRYKGKGKKKKPILEDRIDDINLINDLTEKFQTRRLSKNDKRQLKKQNKRNGALIHNFKDLSQKYPFAMDINDINLEIIDFLQDLERMALTFPCLGNSGNSEVMRHCSFYNTKSRVMGTNNKKYVVAIKTKKTHRIGHLFTKLPMVSSSSQNTVRVFERTDVKLGNFKINSKGDRIAIAGYIHIEGTKVGENAPVIDENNIGRQLLMKLGWSKGEGLGADHNKGISEPLVATFKRSKKGLRINDA